MYLTGKEIKDLAEYAGFTVSELTKTDSDIFDQEFYVHDSVSGLTGHAVSDDDGSVKYYNKVVTCDGCDGNECSPLGDALKV